MKTKSKKLLSIMLTLVMLMGSISFTGVFAETEEIDGLYVVCSAPSTVTYSTERAYSGSRSVEINAKGAKVSIGDPVEDFHMDPAKGYGIEFYIYVDEWTSGTIEIKPNGNDNSLPSAYYVRLEHGGAGLYLNAYNQTQKDRWGLEKITDGEKAGWYRVWNKTVIYSDKKDFSSVEGYGKGYMWYTTGTMKVKLDNINIYEWTGYDSSVNSGTRGTTPVFTQDFEKNIVKPTIPNQADLDTNVGLTLNAGYVDTGAFYGATSNFAYTGEKSLYVDSTAGSIGLGSGVDDFGLEKAVPYGFKFSIYIAENTEGKLQIKPQNNGNQTYMAVYYTEITGTSESGLTIAGNCKGRWTITEGTGAQAGWYRFESTYPIFVENTDDAAFLAGAMFNFEGKFKAFIDDIEIYNWTKEPATGAGFADGMGTTLIAKRDFETPAVVGPELPNKEDLDTNVGLTLNAGYVDTGAFYGATSNFAYTGEKSLYVDSTAGSIGLGSGVDDFGLEKAVPYGFKFSIYIAENTEGKLQIKPQNNGNQTYLAVYYTEITGTSESGLTIAGNCKDRWTITEGTGAQAGWYRFESKYPIFVENTDAAAFLAGAMFNFEGKFKAFIDDIEIYNWTKEPATGAGFADGMGTTLIGKRDFETPAVVGPELPNKEDLDTNVGLTLNAGYVDTGAFYGATSNFAYTGEKSLYVDSTAGSIGLGSCPDDFGLEKAVPYGLKFSIYIAENTEGVLQIRPQNGGNATYSTIYYTEISGTSEDGLTLAGGSKDRWIITEGTGDKEGWYRFESTYPILVENTDAAAFLAGAMFNFEGKFKAFIDDIEIYNWTKEPVQGAGIANGMGTELIAKRDFEAPAVIEPELPTEEDLDPEVGLRENTAYTNTGAFYGITDVRAYTGGSSLYVDSTAGSIGLGSCPDDFGLEKAVPYGFKFSIYIAENIEGMLQIKPQNNGNQTYMAVYYTEITGTSESGLAIAGNCKDRWTITEGTGAQAGWYRFESKYPIYVENTDAAAFLPGAMFNFEGKFKAFIDDIEIYNWTKEPVEGADIVDGMGTTLIAKRDFEKTGDYISKFNKEVNGKNVTVSVDIRNYTKGDNFTAQLFLAVYSGNTMESLIMTNKTAISQAANEDDPTTPLSQTVFVPEGKTLRIFLWDGLDEMHPLKKSESYMVIQ